MIVFPAIDLKDGKVVRLYKGDFATVHQVADDPVETARQFLDAGCTHLHMVDLDGARDGQRKNGRIVREVCRTGLKVELGGGIRTPEDAQAVFDMGVERCVIGSAAVANLSSADLTVADINDRMRVILCVVVQHDLALRSEMMFQQIQDLRKKQTLFFD